MDENARFIVITGATRGLGRALTHSFSQNGHQVAGCGTNGPHIADLQLDPGPADNFSVIDVTKSDEMKCWADGLIQRHGPPDLLILNAGVMNQHAATWEITPAEWERMMQINVLGAANTIHAFAPAMVERKRGIIVGFSSGAGQRGIANISPYCTSKFALEGMLKSLAAELPDGMASIPLQPGAIDTDILRSHWGEDRSGRQPSPEKWAQIATPYILSLGPEHNGQSLRIEF
ncbi:MAG: SDR family oxidoreductase [Puniceicoccales bacterium]